jgi:hypothetical protein
VSIAEGFALAATVRDDRAPPVERLAGPRAVEVERVLSELRTAERHLRRARILAIADRLKPPPLEAPENARVRALLATEVPRELGRAWLAAAPTRRGFSPPEGLQSALKSRCRGTR